MSKPVAVVTAMIPVTVDKFDRELIRQVQTQGYDARVISFPALGDPSRTWQTVSRPAGELSLISSASRQPE